VLKRVKIIAELRLNIRNFIHVSFDLWTSQNSLIFMLVMIHYIDSNYKNRTRLISMRRLYGDHSRKNQVALLLEILNNYKLNNLLGYFVSDNTTINDGYIDSYLQTL